MKIALVSPYDFAHPGGVVNHVSCLEQQFTRMGHDVKIIAPGSKAMYTLGDRFIRIGTPRPIPVSGSIARITLSLRIEHEIKDVFARENFDICHLHEPLMPTLCTTVLRLKRAPMVGTFHASGGKPWYTMFSPIMKWYLDRWWSKLDGRITVSHVAKDYVNTYFPAEYTTIPNGIDTHHFNNGVAPFEQFQDGKTNILFVGRLEKRKGFEYLLEAFQLVKKEVRDCRLIQVGPGKRLLRKYQKRVVNRNIGDVHFTGYATYADLPRYYKTGDIVCFPNTGWESFGIVLLEAMAVGRPIVASDINGFNAVLTSGREGIAVPPRNADKLAEAILKLIRDKRLRQQMGERGKENAYKYDWEILATRLLDFYTDTLNRVHHQGDAPGASSGDNLKRPE
ncbi:MAG: glycosyltransferase family 4 protein [Dehalococcoidales bacterium]|nr:glycosyltransferase family 4 protein [Dehalococcoidales bacterium]